MPRAWCRCAINYATAVHRRCGCDRGTRELTSAGTASAPSFAGISNRSPPGRRHGFDGLRPATRDRIDLIPILRRHLRYRIAASQPIGAEKAELVRPSSRHGGAEGAGPLRPIYKVLPAAWVATAIALMQASDHSGNHSEFA